MKKKNKSETDKTNLRVLRWVWIWLMVALGLAIPVMGFVAIWVGDKRYGFTAALSGATLLVLFCLGGLGLDALGAFDEDVE